MFAILTINFVGPVMCSKAGQIDAASDRSCGSANFASMYDMTMEDMTFGSYGKLPIHRGYKRAYLSVKDQVTKAIHGLLNYKKCSEMDANWFVYNTNPSSPSNLSHQQLLCVQRAQAAKLSLRGTPWAAHWQPSLSSTSPWMGSALKGNDLITQCSIIRALRRPFTGSDAHQSATPRS